MGTLRKRFMSWRKPRIVLAIGVVLVCLGIGLGAYRLIENYRADARAAHETAQANAGQPSDAPSTVKPTEEDINSFTVPATHPRYLRIPKLAITARIFSVGLTQSGSIGTPSNVYDTAWFNQTSLPGQPGAMLIDGHVSSWKTHGVFHDIGTLDPGDTVSIERGDGADYTYKVVKVQVYDTDDISKEALLSPINPNRPGLNLITCSGDIIAGSNSFTKRIIVYTQQI